MSHPIIDVLVPVYNAADTIKESLVSLQRQTLSDIRIIVINDGSSDGTAEIVHELSSEDPRILLISTENRGIVDALNRGLEACEAPFIGRLDADDISFPDRLERQLTYLNDHPDCVAVAGNIYHIDVNGHRTGIASTFPPEVRSDPYWAHCTEPYLMHPFLLARTQALRDVGGYRYAFHAEDTDLYWRLGDLGRLHNLPDFLGEYRMHDKSISGASVLNGRISAVNSQLSALSERRRRNGEPDIVFRRSALDEYKAAVELDSIIAIASEQLSESERAYLEIATASKMLQLSSYRPYSLTSRDKKFIKSAIARNHGLISAENKVLLILRHILGHRVKRRKFRELSELATLGALGAAFVDLPRVAVRMLAASLRRRAA
jgi:glycosyltransferase involved in cell wall biosynthesis